MRSVTITTSFTPHSIASNTASLQNAGGTVTTLPSIGPSWWATACSTVSKTGTPWISRPRRPGVTPPTIRAPAPYSRHSRVRLTASRPVMPCTMNVVVSSIRMLIGRAPWIFSTARRAASCIETDRSAYSTP